MSDLNRRQFLGASAGALAVPALADEKKPVAASDKVRVALVGCGGMGRANLKDFIRLPDFEVTAVCDPDERRLQDALGDLKKAGRNTQIKTEKDFRKVIESKDVDAVIVGTPDHWHAYVLIAACANDKDVYCEKPLSHNITEGRAMVNAAKKHKRVVQIGTQQRSGQHFKDAADYVASGKLGDVTLCRTWITNRQRADELGSPADSDAPQGVDYDLWLGPAPKRAFNVNRFHYQFRWWWDYGNGLCNDWGVHLNDIILWGTKQTAPLSVFAAGGKFDMKDNTDTPDTLDIHYSYPGFTHIYTVRRGPFHYGFDNQSHGMEFQGTKGILTVNRGGWVLRAEGERQKDERHGSSEQHFNHVKNFLHCIRNRSEKTASDIEDMHRATTTCHLANISYKVKRRIFWDPVNERCYRSYDAKENRFQGEDMEANAYLLREPRKPWSLTF